MMEKIEMKQYSGEKKESDDVQKKHGPRQTHYKELENYPTIASNSYRCGVNLGSSEVRSVMSNGAGGDFKKQ